MQLTAAFDNLTLCKSYCGSHEQVLSDFGLLADFVNPYNVESFEVNYDSPSFAGIKYQHKIQHLASTGNLCQYVVHSAAGSGAIRITLQGKYLKQLTAEQQLEILQLAFHLDYHVTRIDLALDLYTCDEVREVLFDEFKLNTHLIRGFRDFRDGSVVDAISGVYKSKCLYFGSKSSDKLLRIYDKNLESKGLTESLRLELQLRASLAQEAALQFKSLDSVDLFPLIIASLHFGNYSFVDLPLWDSLKEKFDSGEIALSRPTKDQTLASLLAWLKKQVAPTLATFCEYYGATKFAELIAELVESGIPRISNTMQRFLNVLNPFRPRIVSRGQNRLHGLIPDAINKVITVSY